MQHINQLNNIIIISSIIHNSLFNKIIKISFKLHHLILHLNPSSHLMTRLDSTQQMQRHDSTMQDSYACGTKRSIKPPTSNALIRLQGIKPPS